MIGYVVKWCAFMSYNNNITWCYQLYVFRFITKLYIITCCHMYLHYITLHQNYNIYISPIVNLINLSHTVRACPIWHTDDDCFHEVQNHVVVLLLNLVKCGLPLKIHMGNTWCTIDIQCMIYWVCRWRLHCLFSVHTHNMVCVLSTVLFCT